MSDAVTDQVSVALRTAKTAVLDVFEAEQHRLEHYELRLDAWARNLQTREDVVNAMSARFQTAADRIAADTQRLSAIAYRTGITTHQPSTVATADAIASSPVPHVAPATDHAPQTTTPPQVVRHETHDTSGFQADPTPLTSCSAQTPTASASAGLTASRNSASDVVPSGARRRRSWRPRLPGRTKDSRATLAPSVSEQPWSRESVKELMDHARLCALDMAASGKTYNQVTDTLCRDLHLSDPTVITDYVFGTTTPASIVPGWPPPTDEHDRLRPTG